MFTEKTYTNGDSEIMVHFDCETDKPLRAYTYKDSIPSLYSSAHTYASRIEEIEDDEIIIKTKPSKNPLFVYITSPRASRLVSILEDNDFVCCDDE